MRRLRQLFNAQAGSSKYFWRDETRKWAPSPSGIRVIKQDNKGGGCACPWSPVNSLSKVPLELNLVYFAARLTWALHMLPLLKSKWAVPWVHLT